MALPVPSRTFCCCLPSRLGVVVIGIIGLIGGGAIATGGVIQANRSTGNKLAYIIQALVYGLLATLSIFGIMGAIFRKQGLIRLYLAILVVHVLLSAASGGFSLYRFFQDAPDDVNQCLRNSNGNNSADEAVLEACQKGMTVIKGVLVGVSVLMCLIEIWGCIIVRNYSAQLGEEQVVARKSKEYKAKRAKW